MRDNMNGWRVLALIMIVLSSTAYTVWDWQFETHRQIESEHLSLIQQLRYKEETLNLSIEFGFDPLIVLVTRQLASEAFQKEVQHPETTWRFIRTERDLTYLILSLIQIESRGDYKAFNPGGPAHGLTQLLLSTARMYDKDVTPGQLLTIPKNLTIAVAHFVDLLEKYHGNFTLAVLAWNRGGGGVDRSISAGLLDSYAYQVFTAALRNAK